MTQHSCASMEIHELCYIIWPLTPAYPISMTWKMCIHPEKMYSPQGVQAWDGFAVLRKGTAPAQGWAVPALQGNPACAVGRPCPASPPLDNRHFAELREVVLRKCWKDLQGTGASPMPFIHLLGFFWFKLSIQLIS